MKKIISQSRLFIQITILSLLFIFWNSLILTGNYPADSQSSEDSCKIVSFNKTSFAPGSVQKLIVLNESFDSEEFPPAGWTIIQNNPYQTWTNDSTLAYSGKYSAVVYNDTSDIPQDEWLISPTFDLSSPGTPYFDFYWQGCKYWSVAPFNNCGLNVYISTDNGNTWAFLWNEEIDTTWQSYAWIFQNIPIGQYVGSDEAKIAFQYEGLDGTPFNVDDIIVGYEELYDVKISDEYPFEYFILPLSQAFVNFKSEAINTGTENLDLVQMTVNVNSGEFTDETVIYNLPSGDTLTIATQNTFYPSASGQYSTVMKLFTPYPETDTINNKLEAAFSVSDSVMARDDGISTGYISLGPENSGVLGQVFELKVRDTLTSVSFILDNPQINDSIRVDIYNFTIIPTNIIASTETYLIKNNDTGWITLPVNRFGFVLSAGNYFAGICHFKNNHISVKTTDFNYKPGQTWISFNMNPWMPAGDYGYEITFLLRENFANVNPAFGILSPDWENIISVFPNPVKNSINIKSARDKICKISLQNLAGSKLYETIVMKKTCKIDVTDFTSGIYYLRVEIGKKSFVRKIIKIE